MTAYGLGDKGAEEALDKQGKLAFDSGAWRWFGARRKQMPDQSRVMGINLIIWGDAGLGKTSCVVKACEVLGKHPYELVLSQCEAGDIGGIPRVQEESVLKRIWGKEYGEGTYTQKIPDAFWRAVAKDPLAVVFDDDLTNCSKDVQVAMLGVNLNRRIPDGKGGFVYIKHAPQIGAANHGEAHSMSPLPGPAANRFGHLVYGPEDDGYLNWLGQPTVTLTMTPEERELAAKGLWDPNQLPSHLQERIAALPNEWNERYARYYQMVSAFIKEVGPKGAIKSPAPVDFTNVEDYAWATYRSWELCARSMAAAEHYNLDDRRLIVGAVGLEMAGKFMDFRNRLLKMPSVDDVFNGNVDWSKLKASETAVLLQWAGAACTDDQQLDAVFNAMTTVRGINQELVRPCEDILVQRAKGLVHNRPLTTSMAARVQIEVRSKMGPQGLKRLRTGSRDLGAWNDLWRDAAPWEAGGPELVAA
jgi:hypothetical protein